MRREAPPARTIPVIIDTSSWKKEDWVKRTGSFGFVRELSVL
jgi:hypothetical protein